MDVRAKLLELRKKAIANKAHNNRYLQDREAVIMLAYALPQTTSLFLGDTLHQELMVRPLYDAVAQWCNPDGELAKSFPLQIVQVAEYILKTADAATDN